MKYIWTNYNPLVDLKNPLGRPYRNLNKHHALIKTELELEKLGYMMMEKDLIPRETTV